MQFTNSLAWITFDNEVDSSTTTKYVHLMMVSSSLNVVMAQHSYFAFDSTTATFFSTTTLITSCNVQDNAVINLFTNSNGYRADVKVDMSLSTALNISHEIASFGCFIAFNISKYTASGTFDFAVSTVLTSNSTYNITYSTRGSCVLDYGIYNGLFVDVTSMGSSQQVFVDYGWSAGAGSNQTEWVSMGS